METSNHDSKLFDIEIQNVCSGVKLPVFKFQMTNINCVTLNINVSQSLLLDLSVNKDVNDKKHIL